jgi:hypothetical protein
MACNSRVRADRERIEATLVLADRQEKLLFQGVDIDLAN